MSEKQHIRHPTKNGPLGILTAFVGTLATTVATLGFVRLGTMARVKMRTRWRTHIPALARAVAEMMAADPSLFTWVPFTAAQLQERVRWIAALLQARQKLTEFTALFDDALIEGKSGLFDWTTLVVDGLYRLLDSPEISGPRREQLLQISAEVRTMTEAHRTQVATALRNTREKNARLAQAEESIAHLTEENRARRTNEDSAAEDSRAFVPGRTGRRRR